LKLKKNLTYTATKKIIHHGFKRRRCSEADQAYDGFH